MRISDVTNVRLAVRVVFIKLITALTAGQRWTRGQTMTKRKPATETCLFCGRKIPDRSNADTIREFVYRFQQTASESTTTLLGNRIVTYRISPEELEELMDNMIAEVIGEDSMMKAWFVKETVNFGATYCEFRGKQYKIF